MIQRGKGCPICCESNGEMEISRFLEEYNIKYTREYCFNDCKYIRSLYFDFYLLDNNICIEFDGQQHFKPMKIFGGDKAFKENNIRDEIKNKYCVNNNIKLIRIKYNENSRNKLFSILKPLSHQ